jgi:hypothetical protein
VSTQCVSTFVGNCVPFLSVNCCCNASSVPIVLACDDIPDVQCRDHYGGRKMLGAKPRSQALGGAIEASKTCLEKAEPRIARILGLEGQSVEQFEKFLQTNGYKQIACNISNGPATEGSYKSPPSSPSLKSRKRESISPCKSSPYDKDRKERHGELSRKLVQQPGTLTRKLGFG